MWIRTTTLYVLADVVEVTSVDHANSRKPFSEKVPEIFAISLAL